MKNMTNNEYLNTNEEFVISRLTEIDPFNNEEYKDLNDITLARLFATVFEDRLIYNTTAKRYMVYDGIYWNSDDETKAEMFAQIFALGLIKFAMNLNNTNLMRRIYRLTERGPRMTLIRDAKAINTCMSSDFDKDPYLLNTKNCIINLRDGSVMPHDKKYKFSKMANVIYDETYDTANRWTQFIDEITSGNRFKAKYLQSVMGYTLLGIKKEEKVWFLHGPSTRNGKSTFIESIAKVLGDYALASNPDSFEKKSFSNGGSVASEDIARLAGSRLVRISEPAKGMKFECKKIKEMTGNDSITARGLYSNSFQFNCSFTFIFVCNDLPIIDDDTMFSSNRIKVIPFNESFPDGSGRQDKNLKELFSTEEYRSIIFNWLLEGLKLYNTYGLVEPTEVIDATNNYREVNDTVQGFINRCLIHSTGYVKANIVYDAYVKYCQISTIPCDGKQVFYNTLRSKGLLVAERQINGQKVKNFIPEMTLAQVEVED